MKGGGPLHLFLYGPTQLAIPKRPAVGSAFVRHLHSKQKFTGAPLHTFFRESWVVISPPPTGKSLFLQAPEDNII